jgi:glycosyltransferase involved in cell wall biosynthesis
MLTAMMTSSPKQELVSVIIPCYNHAHFLGEAIASVINQTYPHIEIIVVDDGSTDHSAQVAAAHPSVRYVRQENLGVSRARNTGLLHSRGAYLLFLDADDRLLPDAIEVSVHALASRIDCAFVFGPHVSFGTSQGLLKLPHDQVYNYQELLKRNIIGNPGSALYNRWVFSHVVGFDETNGPAADYDLALQIARQFPILCHYRPVVEYRRHADNMSNNAGIMLKATLTALKKQRKHVKGNQELRAAYEVGRRHWKTYYGEPLIVSMCENIARGNVMKAACDCYTLVRLFPERFPIFVVRKIGKLYLAVREALF